MYNQNFQQSNFSNQSGAGFANSQYRGYAAKYQPVGMVQSQYNQSLNNQSISSQQFSSQPFAAQYTNYQSPQSFHTANYRGDQQGHDAYLRSDSTQPAQFATGFSASSYGTSMGAMNQIQNQSQYAPSQFVSSQSYHTANYRGDQPGHDAYLRADSTQPTNSQINFGASSFNNQFGTPTAQFTQATNPQAYHTANYRGNQQGHDAYLRSDSVQPAQSQFGMSSMNRYQF